MISAAKEKVSGKSYMAIYKKITGLFYKFFFINVIVTSIIIAFKEPLDFLFITWVLLSSALIQSILYFYGVFNPQSSLFVDVVGGKDFLTQKNAILFRFDDGPDPRYTLKILDILKEHKIQAVFAVTGERAEKYPHIIERIGEENHIICNHSYSHSYLISLFSYKKLSREIQRTNNIIHKITEKWPEYYCPPMGHKNMALRKVLKHTGQKVLGWDTRTYDTKRSTDEIVNQVQEHMRSPAIILFHDGVFKWTKEDRQSTVESLKVLIQFFKSKGYFIN